MRSRSRRNHPRPTANDLAVLNFGTARELLFNGDTTSRLPTLSLFETGPPTLRASDSGQATDEFDRIVPRTNELPVVSEFPTMARSVQLMDGKIAVETAASSEFSPLIEPPNEL